MTPTAGTAPVPSAPAREKEEEEGRGGRSDFQSILLGESGTKEFPAKTLASSSTQAAALQGPLASRLESGAGGGVAAYRTVSQSVQNPAAQSSWNVYGLAPRPTTKAPAQKTQTRDSKASSTSSPRDAAVNVSLLASPQVATEVREKPSVSSWEQTVAARQNSSEGKSVSDGVDLKSDADRLQGMRGSAGGEMPSKPCGQDETGAVVQTRATQQANTIVGSAGEKIAAADESRSGVSKADHETAIKDTLVYLPQHVASDLKGIGTGVAMPTATMSNDSTAQPSAIAFAGASTGAADETGARHGEAEAGQLSASTSVENVLQVGDLQAAASHMTQSAVSLRFNVAGEDLAVRVALQAGQVHTQFSASSGELRAALAHEWQVVGSASAGQLRLAEPVFTAGPRGDSRSSPDLGGNSGEHSGQRRELPGDESGAPSAVPTSAASSPSTHADPLHEAEAGSSMLHSFA